MLNAAIAVKEISIPPEIRTSKTPNRLVLGFELNQRSFQGRTILDREFHCG